MRKIIFSLLVLACASALAQMPKQLNSAEIYQEIKKLNVVGNVLYLAAHPDDENTRFISYCANEKLYNTAYLSLTRGSGGQNLIGTEIREELGIIRTQELLAARRTDGGTQFFTRANDFGYSKTPEETLEIWDKEKILGDVVWVIRKFRPDVIVCRFPTDGGGGHGHHTASALLAKEAFGIAGDSTKYPEHLEYVDVWQPTRVVVNTGRWWNDSISSDDPGVVAIDIGKYNPVLGTSYNELAARSRSQHKSQGFGSTGARGEQIEYFEHLVGTPANDDLFGGYASDWSRIEGGEKIEKAISKLLKNFDVANSGASYLGLYKLKDKLLKNFNKSDSYIAQKVQDIENLMLQTQGIYIETVASQYSAAQGDSVEVTFELLGRNSYNPTFLSKLESPQLEFQKRRDTFSDKQFRTIKIAVNDLPISQPYWLAKEGTLGTYNVTDQNLIGLPENNSAVSFTATYGYKWVKQQTEVPLVYKWNDPVKGEMYRPFVITPAVTANVSQPINLFSTKEPRQVEITLKAHSDNQEGWIAAMAPKGWKVDYDKIFSLAKKGDEQKVILTITPGERNQNGPIKIKISGKTARAINTITYDHIPTQVWFPESEINLIYVDVKTKSKKIGYVVGAGDLVPDALQNIGYQVDLLTEADLELANLKQYDAILTGIRFFNVDERSPYMAPKLMEYVKQGGNLIVQYNTRHRMKTQDFGPYPITLSRDRVTEEDSEVKFLAADHPVMNSPNKITQADFDNWVQERGLYFPSEWDEKYTPLLSWHDKDETPKEGALLVAKYGKGNYAYTGISFFRELPAGVPGAYRLLVNLIEMSHE
jgi:LmbE family N-acetylglucosaminyl deacetylase